MITKYSKKNYLFLLDFQASQGFQGNLSDQVVQALRELLGHPGVQEDRGNRESCYGIRREPGWASFQPWSSDLKQMNKLIWNSPLCHLAQLISGPWRIAVLTVDELLANLSCNGAHHVLRCSVSLETKKISMLRSGSLLGRVRSNKGINSNVPVLLSLPWVQQVPVPVINSIRTINNLYFPFYGNLSAIHTAFPGSPGFPGFPVIPGTPGFPGLPWTEHQKMFSNHLTRGVITKMNSSLCNSLHAWNFIRFHICRGGEVGISHAEKQWKHTCTTANSGTMPHPNHCHTLPQACQHHLTIWDGLLHTNFKPAHFWLNEDLPNSRAGSPKSLDLEYFMQTYQEMACAPRQFGY